MTDLVRSTWKRCGLALLSTLLFLSPEVANAQAGAPMSLIGNPVLGPAIGKTDYSLLVALEFPPSDFSVGPRLTGEVMYGLMDLAPQLRLDLGGRLSWAYHSWSPGFANVSGSIWMFDFVPDAKLRYAVNDQLGVYGDFGLGLAWMHASAEQSGFGSASDDSVALAVQFGAGVAYAVTPTLNLLGELRFNIYSKSGYGLAIAVPTIGVEFH